MFGFKTFGAGLILGGAAGLFATNYHVVQTDEGMVVLPRSSQPPLRSSYIDVRKWNLAMWEQHPEVASAMVKSGRTDLMVNGTLNNLLPVDTEPSTLEQFGQSVTEKTKEAYKSLIPIKFTNKDGEEVLLPSGVQDQTPSSSLPTINFGQPNDVSLGESTSIISTPPQYEDTQQFGNLNQVQEQIKEILPQHIDVPEFSLPKLQNPVPIQDDPFQQVSQTVQQPQPVTQELPSTSLQEQSKAEWVRGLLNTLIPQDASAPVPQNYGQAELPEQFNAPNPLENLGNQTSSLLQKQMQDALPTFKPF